MGSQGASNGKHMNFSIWRGGKEGEGKEGEGKEGRMMNAMVGGDSCQELSPIAKSFIAGVLTHGPALQALSAPTVSCYRRVADWSWAPTRACWGVENRSGLIRAKVRRTNSAWTPSREYLLPYLPTILH